MYLGYVKYLGTLDFLLYYTCNIKVYIYSYGGIKAWIILFQ